MRVFSSNILFLSKYLVSITCKNLQQCCFEISLARCHRGDADHARTSASRERNFETEHCCKLWKQDIYLEIRYLRKIPAFLGHLCCYQSHLPIINLWSFVVTCAHLWFFVVIRGRSWSFVVIRGHSWSFVVTRGHSWSLVVIRGHSCVLLDKIQTLPRLSFAYIYRVFV